MNTDFDTMRVLYFTIILLLVASAWLRLRGDFSTEIKNLLVWVILLALLVLGWSLFH